MTRRRPPIPPGASPSRRGGGSGEPAPDRVPPASESEGPWLLDSREIARVLGISRTKAFQLMSTGVIPVVRIGRCARAPRLELGKWIDAQTIAPRQVG
jgi:excisionase family DNA binding protein